MCGELIISTKFTDDWVSPRSIRLELTGKGLEGLLNSLTFMTTRSGVLLRIDIFMSRKLNVKIIAKEIIYLSVNLFPARGVGCVSV